MSSIVRTPGKHWQPIQRNRSVPFQPVYDENGKCTNIPDGCRQCKDCKTIIYKVKYRPRCLDCFLKRERTAQGGFDIFGALESDEEDNQKSPM